MKNKIYKSQLIDSILDNSKEEFEMTKERMLLAARIKKQMNKLGMKNSDLAKALNLRSTSIVTKWLSGNHNFTSNTLFSIQKIIGIRLINNDSDELIKSQYEFMVKFDKSKDTLEVTANEYASQENVNKIPISNGSYKC